MCENETGIGYDTSIMRGLYIIIMKKSIFLVVHTGHYTTVPWYSSHTLVMGIPIQKVSYHFCLILALLIVTEYDILSCLLSHKRLNGLRNNLMIILLL